MWGLTFGNAGADGLADHFECRVAVGHFFNPLPQLPTENWPLKLLPLLPILPVEFAAFWITIKLVISGRGERFSAFGAFADPLSEFLWHLERILGAFWTLVKTFGHPDTFRPMPIRPSDRLLAKKPHLRCVIDHSQHCPSQRVHITDRNVERVNWGSTHCGQTTGEHGSSEF